MERVVSSLKKVIYPISIGLLSVGVSVLAAMMFLTASDVTLRYVFNSPISGAFDLTSYMMVILVGFGFAYCAVKKGHVRVDLVVERLPLRTQAIIDSITGLMVFFLLVMLTWQGFRHMIATHHSGVTSAVLHIPVYPFAGLVGLGFASFTLVVLVDLIEVIGKAVRR